MIAPSLSTSSADGRSRLFGAAAVLIVLALTGIPFLVLGSLRWYVLVIPMMAGVLAVALYAFSRPVYVAFSLWVWFLIPLVRRLLDYGMGAFTDKSFVLTAPYLVGGVGVLGLWSVLTTESRGVRQAFAFLLIGIGYGAAVGLVLNGFTRMATDALEWGIPLVTAALILADWRQYPQYRDVILRTVTVGMGVLGVYGIYQFFVLPPWDRMWMEAVGDVMINIGRPEPLEVRVFGTLNSPNPYGITMAVGLLALLASGIQSQRDALIARLAAVPAGLALALSMVRSGWGAYAVGLVYVIFVTQSRNRWRLLLFIGLAALALTPLLLLEPVSVRVSDRASSFTDITNDGSFKDRAEMYQAAIPAILQNPVGWGLGNRLPADSGLVRIFLSMGWGGTALYLTAMVLLFLWAWRMRGRAPTHDPFIHVATGIALAVAATVPLGTSFEGVKGVYLWGFLALALAGIRYYAAAEQAPPTLLAPGEMGPPPERVPETMSG